MTDQEFTSQMNRLAETYSKGAFSNERVKLIWAAVKDLPSAWLAKTVSEMISSLRQAPMPPDFVEAARAERARTWEKQKHSEPGRPWDQPHNCTYCFDTGVFLACNLTRVGTYAFRCACSRGLNDARTQIPFCIQSHHDDGFRFYDIRSGT